MGVNTGTGSAWTGPQTVVDTNPDSDSAVARISETNRGAETVVDTVSGDMADDGDADTADGETAGEGELFVNAPTLVTSTDTGAVTISETPEGGTALPRGTIFGR